MRRGYLPVKDADLLAWSRNLSAELSSDPSAYGVSPGDAAAFAAVQAAFEEAMRHVLPESRSRVSVSLKDDARRALEVEARRINAMVRGSGIVDGTKLATLGLTVHKTTYRRIAAPTTRPFLAVASVTGPVIKLMLRESGGAECKLPADVASAAVYHWIGDEPPVEPARWILAAHVSRARLALTIDAAPGTKIWFIAHYLNRRGERGPWGNPAATHAMGGMIIQSLSARAA